MPPNPAPSSSSGDLGAALTEAAAAASTGYAPPVPPQLLQANPSWMGESTSSAAGSPTPAAPVTLPVPQGTPVAAVTGGTVQITGTTVTLTGGDGATYTLTGVDVPPTLPSGATVTAGQPLGTAAPGGITFNIAIPDVAGSVCADSALQSWSAGAATDVRSLPNTCLAGTSPNPSAPVHVLVVTDGQAGSLASDLTGQFTGTDVTTSTVTVDLASPAKTQAAAITAAQPQPALVVLALPDAGPTTAAALAPLLPAGEQMLWVAGPSADPAIAAGYQALVAAHPGVRVETPPSALASLDTAPGQAWSGVLPQVVSLLAARYAGSAYRLPTTSARTAQVLAYAEEQLGKPYQWAGAGPATFDCSGLTMQAYAAAGLAMPHNAYAQYEQTKGNAVPEDQLQPGDLVFFGPSIAGIEHVGIYTGNGTFLDAPDTGSFVRYDHLGPGWDYQGATRPLGQAGSLTSAGATPASTATPGGAAGAATPASTGATLTTEQAFAQALVTAMWDNTQFPFLQALWQRESGWNPTATNPTSGAYGIAQALPASKMASVSSDWATDPFTQILWGLTYVQSRYGSPQAAWAHEVAAGWY